MSCSPLAGQMPKPPAISVNGVVIARDAISREAQNHPAPTAIEAWRGAAEALVVRELLLQEARRLGLTPASPEGARRTTDEDAQIDALIEREVTTPEATDEECRRYYERNRARFVAPTMYEVSHILFAAAPDDPDGLASARATATAALAQLRDDPDSFAALARAYSACPSAAEGGHLGQITSGQTTAEFDAALTRLEAGQTTHEPVQSRFGLHIIRLHRKAERREQPYLAVAERLAAYLSDRVRRRAIAQYIARLAERAQIRGLSLGSTEAHRVH